MPRQCLLSRRLIERGVRFVELSCLTEGIGAGNAANPWDQHGALEKGHAAMAHQVDQPIAGLLQDLKIRGLLDETLVIWAENLAELHSPKEVTVVTIIHTDSRFGWLVVELKEALCMARQMNLDIMLPKTNVTFMIFGQPCFTS